MTSTIGLFSGEGAAGQEGRTRRHGERCGKCDASEKRMGGDGKYIGLESVAGKRGTPQDQQDGGVVTRRERGAGSDDEGCTERHADEDQAGEWRRSEAEARILHKRIY